MHPAVSLGRLPGCVSSTKKSVTSPLHFVVFLGSTNMFSLSNELQSFVSASSRLHFLDLGSFWRAFNYGFCWQFGVSASTVLPSNLCLFCVYSGCVLLHFFKFYIFWRTLLCDSCCSTWWVLVQVALYLFPFFSDAFCSVISVAARCKCYHCYVRLHFAYFLVWLTYSHVESTWICRIR